MNKWKQNISKYKILDLMKAIQKGKVIVLPTYLPIYLPFPPNFPQERFHINNLVVHLKVLEKKEKNNAQK